MVNASPFAYIGENMRKIKSFPCVGEKREKEGEEKWERWMERERLLTDH